MPPQLSCAEQLKLRARDTVGSQDRNRPHSPTAGLDLQMWDNSALCQGHAAEVRISLVVSTFNRENDLPRLFHALEQQSITGRTPWELILVDNCSTDGTAKVACDLAARSGFPVVRLFEPRKGKSYGLNRGIAAARGSIVAFTDDDGIPAPDWLEQILSHFEANSGSACVGGRVERYNEADALVTVRLSTEARTYGASDFDASNIPVIGCNMAIDAAALKDAGLYDTDIGPGSRIGVAEDVDILYRLVRRGHRIAYDPRLLVFHNHGRRTAREVEAVREGYVVGRGAFYCKHVLLADLGVARTAYWELAGHLGNWLTSGVLTEKARESFRSIVLLAKGAARYLRYHGKETKPVCSL